MRKAIIDLGTNTFNLLVADVSENDFEMVYSEKDAVAIGMGGINQKEIVPESRARAMTTLKKFREKAKGLNCNEVLAFATSAIRDAKNGESFVREVYRELEMEIRILSGDEEAMMIYEGVKHLPDCPKDAVIFDIGGGSSEVISIRNNKIDFAHSFNIGVSRLYQMRQYADPLSLQDIAFIEAFLEEQTEHLKWVGKQAVLIGSSGSFETFYELIHGKEFPHDRQFYPLNFIEFAAQLESIICSTLNERKSNPWIMPIRQIMLHITAVKIRWFMNKTNTKQIQNKYWCRPTVSKKARSLACRLLILLSLKNTKLNPWEKSLLLMTNAASVER